MADKPKSVTTWLYHNWRSLAFVVYCFICVFDFIIMPGIIESLNKHIDASEAIRLALQFKDPSVQMQIIKELTTKRAWAPLTMDGAATFHLAWGALLTGAAITRGQEKIAQIKSPITRIAISDDSDDDRETESTVSRVTTVKVKPKTRIVRVMPDDPDL